MKMFYNKKYSQLLLNSYSKFRQFQSKLHCEKPAEILETKWKEFEIPVPWGKIAAKWWGPQDKQPILVVHGWQDTAGSFDTLIPLLYDQIPYLVIDYPGHGLSSPFPKGMYYHFGDAPIILRRIHKYFGWPKISLMGHSLGGDACLIYAGLFPNDVNMLIEIDCLKPYTYEPGENIDNVRRYIESYLRYDEYSADDEPKSFPLEELQMKLHLGLKKSIDLDKVKYILDRMMKQSKNDPNKYYFTRDPRLKIGNIVTWIVQDIVEHVKRIHCPMMHITMDSKFIKTDKHMYSVIDTLKKSNDKFIHIAHKGKHHHHLNHPEMIAGYLNDFIMKYYVDTVKLNGKI